MEFTKEQLELFLAAVRATRLVHNEAIAAKVPYVDYKMQNGAVCALCSLSLKLIAKLDTIPETQKCMCPWLLFTERSCIGTGCKYNYKDSPQSVLRLTKWESELIKLISAKD